MFERKRRRLPAWLPLDFKPRYRRLRTSHMTRESRRLAGYMLLIAPVVAILGIGLMLFFLGNPQYMDNPLRRAHWRQGELYAGVMLVLALIILRYVDEARLSEGARQLVRVTIPLAALLLPAAFFLSVLSPDAREPNQLINLAWVGAAALAVGSITLAVGLLKATSPSYPTQIRLDDDAPVPAMEVEVAEQHIRHEGFAAHNGHRRKAL